MKKEFIKIKVDELIPYENNPRINENAVPDTMESIRQCENLDPIEVDENNVILSGHTRLLALKRLGYNETEVVRYTGLTEKQKKKYRILANKVGEKSEWDFSKLEEELADLDFGDFDFGFNTDDNSEGEETEITEDEPPVDVETKCKLGDLWVLGNHRLICGDSTDIAVIDRLMDGVKADMVMTDPPYGINAEKMTMGAGAKEFYRGEDGWDSKRPDISNCFSLADNVCIWGGNYFADLLPVSNDWLVWHKKNDGRSFSECELAWTNFRCNVRYISHHWGGEKKLHVTMKPVEVIAWAIQQAKEKAEVIVDLFGGSGSTLIACEQLNRKCFICELDPHYCDVIISRWETFTGKKAEKID